MKAIETSGTINKSGLLKLDRPLVFHKKQKLKVIILYEEDDRISDDEWLKALSTNPVFDFLKDEKEDIYTLADGKPI